MGMDVYSRDEGHYFRANVWSWRPIHLLCQEANERMKLGFDMEGWATNDGYGLADSTECSLLADALEIVLEDYPERITLDSEPQGVEGEVMERLQKIGAPAALTDEQKSWYATNKEHVKEFISFLRKSPGFRVW